jgi:integrase/recombinase XerC
MSKPKPKRISAADLVAAHLARPSATSAAYRADLVSLTKHLLDPDEDTVVDLATIQGVVASLIDQERGLAQMALDRYASTMLADGVPINSIRRRIASTLSLLGLAHRYDLVTWTLSVKLPAAAVVKDTRGPGIKAVKAMFEICRTRGDRKGRRDSALMSLLYYHALRRGEIISLDLCNVDLAKSTIAIKRKGKVDRIVLGLCDTAADDLDVLITERGTHAGALFESFGPRLPDRTPLPGAGLYHIVRTLGRKVGVETRPHGIRHTAISRLLQLTNGNIAEAMGLSGHSDPKTLIAYDDARLELHQVAALKLDHDKAAFSPWDVRTH